MLIVLQILLIVAQVTGWLGTGTSWFVVFLPLELLGLVWAMIGLACVAAVLCRR